MTISMLVFSIFSCEYFSFCVSMHIVPVYMYFIVLFWNRVYFVAQASLEFSGPVWSLLQLPGITSMHKHTWFVCNFECSIRNFRVISWYRAWREIMAIPTMYRAPTICYVHDLCGLYTSLLGISSILYSFLPFYLENIKLRAKDISSLKYQSL